MSKPLITEQHIRELERRGHRVTRGTTVAERIRAAALKASGTVEIVLPMPPEPCWPNSRSHYMVKARAVRLQRDAATAVGVATCGVWFEQPLVSATFWHRTKRRRDRDGGIGSLKGAMDGLSDAMFWCDDSVVRWGEVEHLVDPDDPRVVLTIEERTPGASG
jgi:Holliday junction resolvase RusA-like endonuclease